MLFGFDVHRGNKHCIKRMKLKLIVVVVREVSRATDNVQRVDEAASGSLANDSNCWVLQCENLITVKYEFVKSRLEKFMP